MATSEDIFSCLDPYKFSPISMGDDAPIQINHYIKGELDMDLVIIDETIIVVSSIASSNI